MFVLKRDGKKEEVAYDKITRRISSLCDGLDKTFVCPQKIAQKVIEGVYDGVTTSNLDNLAAETCAYMSQMHPDFSLLAARIAISNLHKMTSESVLETAKKLYYYTDEGGRDCALVSEEYFKVVEKYADAFQKKIDYNRDFGYDYFGFKTLERSYLLKVEDKIVERPQHLIMRCAVGIHMRTDDKEDGGKELVEKVCETYDYMSGKFFTHATPTLFNAGTPKNQMSSCFLLSTVSDSIDGIYETLRRCAKISKCAGGIGVSISNVRASGSYIRGTNGNSNGLVPMLKVFNDTARYVDQGGGRRKGAFAMYLEPWHADVFDFLDLKKNHGKEENRARDLFYALWIPDLFMKKVKNNEDWHLFCPDETFCTKTNKSLLDLWGDAFEARYNVLVAEGKFKKVIPAQSLWTKILESQMETGVPYMCYKDAANSKSNQMNLGTIKSSNLCTEIFEYTSPDEVAVCNLASIALPMFVREDLAANQKILEEAKASAAEGEAGASGSGGGKRDMAKVDVELYKKVYDFETLHHVAKVVTRNLNKVIDINYYPVKEARNSNMRHRPIGIGCQGLADTFMKLRMPFESEEARDLNQLIFETMYHGAVEASMELASVQGAYESYKGCPIEKDGKLQYDLWGVAPSGLWDWAALKKDIEKNGMRNSLLLAPMPTASTAQILGNNESFEPYTQNIYVRRVLSGEFVTVNRHLLRDLISEGLWDEDMKNMLIAANGSVQGIELIPAKYREIYKTVWEIKQKRILDLAADRGAFIDQSQSLNIHLTNCTAQKLSSMHFHGWQLGLKTGQYYLRTKAAVEAIKFTVDSKKKEDVKKEEAPVKKSKYASFEPKESDSEASESESTKESQKKERKSKYSSASADTSGEGGEEKKEKKSKYSSAPAEGAADGTGASADPLAALKAQQAANSKYECIGCGS